MTRDEDAVLAAHQQKMIELGQVPMTAEEILSGKSQGGVPRPSCLKDDEDDGTREFVSGPGDAR